MDRPSAATGTPLAPAADAAAQLAPAFDDRPAVDPATFGALLDLVGLRRRDEFLAHIASDLDDIGRRFDEAADRGDRRALADATHALAGLAATIGAARLAGLARGHGRGDRLGATGLRLAAARLESEIAAVRSACTRLAAARRPI